ncbi:peptidase A24A prepilin type IV [Gluconacetobacter diazotrophicus PA1 5]|uniref:Prepilin type IV endopeptidase peptidase domain-containing protein n=3 Tax=Gluconacetobacter diazotrophicus TaxID=33996 RepID=A9HHL2_GLUDA|nr:peptidase A24A prepilin type IV [Gluconacetobacter diazotrophicus PA1 5]MBB2156039.1 prepilin peptidase [Gluconacetobacter diazotrophicus]TWB10416.1 prepilin peptidase CpaA [Gluconacetobacter diazotrophicus]CAP55648.1 conserved hypothetical protein [Gluconacetobacter diazotrophicus PA1 5]
MGWVVDGLVVISTIFLVYAALHDVAVRTIPDQVVVALGGLGATIAILHGHIVGSILVAICVFGLCFAIWWFGAIGGGDVKLLSAASLLFPPAAVPSWILTIAMSGGVLAGFYLMVRHRVTVGPVRHGCFGRIVRSERWRMRRGGPLPYAVAIAAGSCFQLIR